MTFLTPWMLLGGAAISVPIAVHFFFKARYRPLPWGAMKFLQEAIEQTSRRLKFQEWILLALRCLVILLLALALARPGLMTAGAAGRGDAVDAVLVIDNSYSMEAQDGDKTRLERAKEAALGVIDTLPANSTVQVYTCSDRTTLLGPISRSNLDQARELVKTVRASSLATDFLPGLTQAIESIDAGTSPVKEIYLFTDMHKLGFERQQGALKAKCDEIKEKANLVFVRCGNAERRIPNVAVTDINSIGLMPHTDTGVSFRITLRNSSSETVKGVKVGLEVEGKPVATEPIVIDEIGPGQSLSVTQTGLLSGAGGYRLLTARLTGDQLPSDNRFDKLVLVRDKIRVLVVDGDRIDRPVVPGQAEVGADFIEQALAPGIDRARNRPGSKPGDNTSFIQPEVRTAREVKTSDLSGKDIVFLSNVAAPDPTRPGVGLSSAFLERLVEFVNNGGGLVISCGPNAESKDGGPGPSYNRAFGSGGAHLLPFDLPTEGSLTESAPASSPFHPIPDSIDPASFLAPLRERPFSTALQAVRILRMMRQEESGPTSVGGRVLLRTNDQRPLISARVVGNGEVLLIGTTLDERWADLAGVRSDAFISLTQFTIAHLTSRAGAGGNQVAGEPIVWFPREATGSFDLIYPQRANETSPRRVRLGQAQAPTPGERLSITATDTGEAGIYRIVPEGKGVTVEDPVFAVNPDLSESLNLDVAADADLGNWLGFTPAVIQAGMNTETAVVQNRAHREWTEWLLLGLLLFLIGESAWAWFCGKAW